MSTKHSTDLIPVVLYLRCSSPGQELSVEDQRREVLAYCERKGYRVVAVYIDEGKSASKKAIKRDAFNKMLADSNGGEFRVIVCWNAARFTRLDNLDGGMAKSILRTNGVMLDTVREGEFDWNEAGGRWKDQAFAESNKATALAISADSNRGRVNVLKLGLNYWPNGVLPYGYDRLYTDGVNTISCRREEKARKPKGWHLRLVVNDAEAEVVREVFRLRVECRWSLRQIAIKLNEKRVSPPKGPGGKTNGSWSHVNVAVLLREKAYIGIASIGNRRKLRTTTHNKIDPVEVANSCPSIIEPHVWREAQEIATQQQEAKAKPQTKRGGVLSGFLVCGHCGYRLSKRDIKGKAKYQCTSRGIRPHLGCKSWGVNESEILPKAWRWLVEVVDSEIVKRLQAAPPEGQENDEQAILEAQLSALDAKVTSGSESALLAPPQAREAAWALVRRWSEEKEAVRQKLELLKTVRSDPGFDEFATWWASAKDSVAWVEPLIYQGEGEMKVWMPVDPDRLRGLLGKLGFTATIWFTEKPEAERTCRMHGFYSVSSVEIAGNVCLPGMSNVDSIGTKPGTR